MLKLILINPINSAIYQSEIFYTSHLWTSFMVVKDLLPWFLEFFPFFLFKFSLLFFFVNVGFLDQQIWDLFPFN